MRTEEQKISQEPITVILGGKEYEVKPLVIKESRLWRREVIKILTDIPTLTKITTDDGLGKFSSALESLLVTTPDTVVDLFFSYAKDLNREEIESSATDKEIAVAWDKVVDLAFPLLQGLVKTMAKMAP